MKRIKDTYFALIIVIGLIVLSLYTTYSMFTANTIIENAINLTLGALPTKTEILEYERITVPANTRKTVDMKISNSTTTDLRYGVWYEMVNPTTKTDDIIIAKYIYSDYETTGSIGSGDNRTIQIIIVNNSSNDLTLNIGVVNSANSHLNLPVDKILIEGEYSDLGFPCSNNSTDFSYTGEYAQYTAQCPGLYTLEVWGAQGGTNYRATAPGGKGGYSIGKINLEVGDDLFVYVGGEGDRGHGTTTTEVGDAGWNGGGNAAIMGGAGGGATDIRLVPGSTPTDDTNAASLLSRIIVAGGGGGSFYQSAATIFGSAHYALGGAAGGTSGANGAYVQSSHSNYVGHGATQTAGGAGGSGDKNGIAGTFGKGGDTPAVASTSNNSNGAGGGGWYGGGSAANTNTTSTLSKYNFGAGGGGGSGFVLTESTASSTPSGYSASSDYWLSNARTYSGSEQFTDFDGSTVTGHEYDGKARISYTSTAPTLTGISDVSYNYGDNVNLTNGVTCVDNGAGCSIFAVKPSNIVGLLPGSYSVNYIVQDDNGKRYLYKRNVTVLSVDPSGANSPDMVSGMIPIRYEGGDVNSWVKADVYNDNNTWYNYSEKRWANVALVESSTRSTYMNAPVGTQVNASDVLAYYVWIPRFKYKVWNINRIIGTDHYGDYTPRTSGIDIVFESGTATTGSISCTLQTKTIAQTCTGSNGQYYTHPAFTFDGIQLRGMWFGKFEATGTKDNPTCLPNQSSAQNVIMGDFCEASRMYANTTYVNQADISHLDTHMQKNTEWGAMAYLTHSEYGRCNDGTCEEVTINNNSSYVTGGGNYINATNVNQSTTGNVYGIYDTSGGVSEFAMGMSLDSTIIKFGSLIGYDPREKEPKYMDQYAVFSSGITQSAYSNSILGDAMGEVVLTTPSSEYSPTNGWYSDFTSFPIDSQPFTIRGGLISDASGAGIFAFHSAVGVAASGIGYRPVIIKIN